MVMGKVLFSKMIKCIIFDFDGVLFDNYEEHYQIYHKRYKDMTRELHRKAFEGNIFEANKIGIKTIAVDFGVHEKERLKKGNPYKIVSNFDELFDEIKKI